MARKKHGNHVFLQQIYLNLHFSPEWVGVTKNFKVYNAHQVHTFDKEKKIFPPTYHIDSMFVPRFAEQNMDKMAYPTS